MEDKNKSWLMHAEFVVLLITLIGGFYLLDGKIEREGCRVDRLYEMFVQLQSQTKDELMALRREQFEILKEMK